MQLTETHIINKNHPFYNECKDLCFKSKNVYNCALYAIKQHYFQTKSYLSLSDCYKQLKTTADYKAIPAKVGNQCLKLADQSFKSFFALRKKGLVAKIPKYKDSLTGRQVVIYEKGALGKKEFNKHGVILLSKTNIKVKTQITDFNLINQVRIIPCLGQFKIEVIYTKQEKPLVTNGILSACDIGLNNLATVGFSNGLMPFIINGRPLKSINQFYNKQIGHYKSKLKGHQRTSKRIQNITNKRNNKIKDYLHKSSRELVNQLVSNQVQTFIVGQNKEWKQEINLGKKTNQNFVNIPHCKFIEMISYKCKLEGITLNVREESYTSKCSFLDLEPICKQKTYLGKRVKRGLFKASNGKRINADVNGMYNIMRKEVPNVFDNGIEGVAVHPLVLTIKG